jgi:hypothetical protein
MVRSVRDGLADVVVAERVRHHTTLRRRVVSRLSRLLLRRLHGLRVDVQAGLKVMRREVLDTVPLAPSAWALDVGLLVGARAAGYVIAGHPIRFDARRAGRTKMRLTRATWEIVGDAVRHRRAARRVSRGVNGGNNLAEPRKSPGLGRAAMAGSAEGRFAPPSAAGEDGITDAPPPVAASGPAEESWSSQKRSSGRATRR